MAIVDYGDFTDAVPNIRSDTPFKVVDAATGLVEYNIDSAVLEVNGLGAIVDCKVVISPKVL